MTSTREPQWIMANNHALGYFGGVPHIVGWDNCKRAVIANRDWIDLDLNKVYAEWAEHNYTVVFPSKVRKPKYKSSVENAVGILEKGFFHDLEESRYFSMEQFNKELWKKLEELNRGNFKKKNYSQYDLWKEEKQELIPLPSVPYEYMERKMAKVSADFHVRFDNAYYSVDKAFLHQNVMIAATSDMVTVYSMKGEKIVCWKRASRKGEWLTDPTHLQASYKQVSEWNAPEHLFGCPKTLDICKDSTERVFLPTVITATLSSLDFEKDGLNVCVLGPSDSGKSYLSNRPVCNFSLPITTEKNSRKYLLHNIIALFAKKGLQKT